MGGNAVARDRSTGQVTAAATRIDFKTFPRQAFIKAVNHALRSINEKFEQRTGSFLWPTDDTLSREQVFLGSSEFVFNVSFSDDLVAQLKPSIGDVDIAVPEEMLDELFEFLISFEGQVIDSPDGRIKYIGQSKASAAEGFPTIHSVFEITQNKTVVRPQIDFVAGKFCDGRPSPFVKFSHSSPFEDLLVGLKGVAHKFLLMSIFRTISERDDLVLLAPSSGTDPDDPGKIKVSRSLKPIRTLGFSVNFGLRSKHIEAMTPSFQFLYYDVQKNAWRAGDLCAVIPKGFKLAVKEIEPSESMYITELDMIYRFAFGVANVKSPTAYEISQMRSFVGLLDLMSSNMTKKVIRKVFRTLCESCLFGNEARKISPHDRFEDEEVKRKIISIFVKRFKFLANERSTIEKMVESFYDRHTFV